MHVHMCNYVHLNLWYISYLVVIRLCQYFNSSISNIPTVYKNIYYVVHFP